MYSIILSVETAFNGLWFVHGMSHLEASTGIGAFILLILLAPTRFRCRTATTSARFGHGCCGINVASKEKHCSMGNVLDCVRAQLNTAQLNAQHNKLHIHENDHRFFSTTDYADECRFYKLDIGNKLS